jgi:hypothetical protein
MATDYTVEPTTAIKSYSVPMIMNSASIYGSITQQLFFPSEMKDADENTPSAGDITKITFYYAVKDGKSAASAISRDIEIWLMEIDDDIDAYQYDNTSAYGSLYKSKFFFNANKKAGVKVYDGKLNTNAITLGDGKQSLPLEITPFAWDGESNIVLTLFDKSSSSSQIGTDAYDNLRFYITETTGGRFVHWRWTGSATDDRNTWMNNLDQYGDTYSTPTNTAEAQANTHRYVSLTTFSIEPAAAPVAPSTPEDLAASNIGSTSASLSWSAVDGATSYDLYHSTTAEGVYTKFASPTTNSYEWSGLTANTTYFVKVAAVNGVGESALSEPISFTTLAPHIHDGITFEPWSNSSAMPTSGNYYLATDVELPPFDPTDITLAGNLNLCLNGHVANVYGSKIVVPDDKTLAIYDNVGGGKITGFVASEVGVFDIYAKALIVVYNGAELDLHQGIIENTYNPDEDGQSYAIYSNGTLRLSGDVLINSNSADIYLHESRVITLDGALTNAEKHTIYKNDGVITSGWSTYMSAVDPRDYLESVNSAKSIYFNGTEAALQTLLTLSETAQNSAINSNDGQIVDVNLTRPLVASQYNTLCLPFELDNTQLEKYFGAGYNLEELTSTSLEDDVLNLTFNKVTALEAGKPYLLKPADDVSSVMFFDDVTIVKTLSNTVTSYVDFKGVYSPTSLEGGNRNLLFLGAGNELFWPASDGEIKAFRAYFEVKGDAQKAAKRARIVKKEDSATGIDQITNDKSPMTNKILRNGEILILRDGKTYNVLGIECK